MIIESVEFVSVNNLRNFTVRSCEGKLFAKRWKVIFTFLLFCSFFFLVFFWSFQNSENIRQFTRFRKIFIIYSSQERSFSIIVLKFLSAEFVTKFEIIIKIRAVLFRQFRIKICVCPSTSLFPPLPEETSNEISAKHLPLKKEKPRNYSH